MTDLPVTHDLRRAGEPAPPPADRVSLTYEDRYFRRRKLVTEAGRAFVAEFAATVSLDAGDVLVLPDGTGVAVAAAAEELYAVTGPDLVRLAWHVGNRHTPCQIGPDRLLIRRDRVIGHMLEHLGATVSEVVAPFTPEGGAYGHGRTHAHAHGHTAHGEHAHGEHGHGEHAHGDHAHD